MQFFLDGFRAGDPDVKPEAVRSTKSDVVDVLVIGHGPAGALIAAQLSEFPGITTRLLERRETPMIQGQADGVNCRSIEMLNAFGLADRLNREGCFVNETAFWGANAAGTGIVRTGRVRDAEDGISEYKHVLLNQARLHEYLAEKMGNSPTRLQPEFGMEVIGLKLPDNPADLSQPVSVVVRQLNLPGQPETVIKAKYVIGCDGARSTVREALGLKLIGVPQFHGWGVLDVLATTDFPDIRRKVIIQAPGGGLAILPREGGYMTRLYVDLGEFEPGDNPRDRVSKDDIVAEAKRLFAPYTFEPKEIPWWSIYEVWQRVTERFDDVPDAERGKRSPRVFTAGDACHTHSAKIGGGMNLSMQDTFNLGWKLAAVLEGRSPVSLLDTYNDERMPLAHEFIEFDKVWAPMVDGKAPDGTTFSTEQLRNRFQEVEYYTAGVATHYPAALLVGKDTNQRLANGFTVGMRFHSAEVTRLADALRLHLGHTHEADGRWRLYAFGDAAPITSDSSRLRALCQWLADSPDSPIRRYTPAGADIDAVFDVRGILQQSHNELEPEDLPSLLLPVKGSLGLNDYEKAFTRGVNEGDKDIFDVREIDRSQGALVVIRPDQYVAHILPLDAYKELSDFFAGFMIPVK